MARVIGEIADPSGHVVIPAGSTVQFSIASSSRPSPRTPPTAKLALHAAGGAVVAAETASRDVVAKEGTPVVFVRTAPLIVKE